MKTVPPYAVVGARCFLKRFKGTRNTLLEAQIIARSHRAVRVLVKDWNVEAVFTPREGLNELVEKGAQVGGEKTWTLDFNIDACLGQISLYRGDALYPKRRGTRW